MELFDLSLVIGCLFFVGLFLVLEKNLISKLFGFAIISNAANLFVLAMSGPPERLRAPLILKEESRNMVDPLPQALILTAIVIGSGILMYLIFLVFRMFVEYQTADISKIEQSSES